MTDFGDTRYPVAAKDHRCEWWGETIQKGEKHVHVVGKWEHKFQNWRMHRECNSDANYNGIEDGFTPYENARPAPSGQET